MRVIESGTVRPAPFLDLSSRVSSAGEVGLLGIVFSPSGERIYAYYTAGGNAGRLVSWAIVNGAVALSTEVTHLVLGDPAAVHNGGQIAFGPDGHLYWALGDGRVSANGQNPTTRRGSIMRIAPTPGGPAPYAIPAGNPFAAGGGAAEVWAYGLRNPWRFSFDRDTGDLWISDVGEFQREEISRLPAGTGAGANLGWAALEGTLPHTTPTPPGLTPPIYEYTRDIGTSVIGGFVYRGDAIASLRGLYVFGDYGNGLLAALGIGAGGKGKMRSLGLEVPTLVSFGQDNAGELYALAGSGEVYRIASTLPPPTPSSAPVGTDPAPGSADTDVAPVPPRKLVRVLRASLMKRGRVLRLKVACSPKATRSCDARVLVEPTRARALARGSASLAAGRFRKLKAGEKRVVKLRLRRPARDRLVRGSAPRARLTITVKARDGAGLKRTTTTHRRLRVSAP